MAPVRLAVPRCYTRLVTPLPMVHPTILERLPAPFEHPDWVFEIKFDGFRAIAYIEGGRCRLVSRKNHVYRSFQPLCDSVARLPVKSAILDGEIVCLDKFGRSVFDRLFYRQGTPHFYAFDLLWLNGRDLRSRPLLERKARLKQVIPAGLQVLYSDHVERRGIELFELICQHDMEGIIGKWKFGRYDQPSWVKIKNPKYSQVVDRREKFEARKHQSAGG